jgi:hypothetical protein
MAKNESRTKALEATFAVEIAFQNRTLQRLATHHSSEEAVSSTIQLDSASQCALGHVPSTQFMDILSSSTSFALLGSKFEEKRIDRQEVEVADCAQFGELDLVSFCKTCKTCSNSKEHPGNSTGVARRVARFILDHCKRKRL